MSPTDYFASYIDPALEVKQTPFAGRAYYTSRTLADGTCVLDVATPYADTIYKQFRNEVCAECWKYDGGRRTFLTARDLGESAGLSFCDNRCKARWLEREGEELAELLSKLETARRRGQKVKEKLHERDVAGGTQVTEQYINKAWETARRESGRVKAVRQWKAMLLDDFEADLARYVLISLYHYSQSALRLRFGMASWDDFAALQSGELQQVTRFPELVSNHIHIYQVLRSRFGNAVPPGTMAPAPSKLAEVLTTENVRRALSVDPGNSFGIWEVPVTEESEGLGFGVYPVPSFFNHNCSPNVRKERVGRRLRFITTRAVAEGEEVCISYGHVGAMSLEQRRKELFEGWFFYCQCHRCVADEGCTAQA